MTALLDAESTTLFSIIRKAAEAGEPCPSNNELAAVIDRAGRHTSEKVTGLALAGLVEIESGGGYRTVRIVGTPHSTARHKNTGWSDADACASLHHLSDPDNYANAARLGCDRLHERTLSLFARKAEAEGCSVTMAMLVCQHGQEAVAGFVA